MSVQSVKKSIPKKRQFYHMLGWMSVENGVFLSWHPLNFYYCFFFLKSIPFIYFFGLVFFIYLLFKWVSTHSTISYNVSLLKFFSFFLLRSTTRKRNGWTHGIKNVRHHDRAIMLCLLQHFFPLHLRSIFFPYWNVSESGKFKWKGQKQK